MRMLWHLYLLYEIEKEFEKNRGVQELLQNSLMLRCAHTFKMGNFFEELEKVFYFVDIFKNGFSSFSGHIGRPRDKYS